MQDHLLWDANSQFLLGDVPFCMVQRWFPSGQWVITPLSLLNNISHLRIFRCAVYVPISLPQCNKMGPQRNICWIWISIYCKYLELTTIYLFTACFTDCHFDESNFPALGEDNKKLEKEICWNQLSLSQIDPRTKQCELEVQKRVRCKT